MSTPGADEGWVLEACATCGGLVFARYDEDGTPTYKPMIPLPEGSTIEELRALQDQVEAPMFPLPDMDFEQKGPDTSPQCNCPEDRNGGDPDQHTAQCAWANAQGSQ